MERREKQVAASEAEVQRLKADLLREHEQKLSFLREASTRMKEDFDHRTDLERMKLEEVKEQCKRYKEQLQAAEKRFSDKENEIILVKEQLLDRPENKLQAELSLALLEKVITCNGGHFIILGGTKVLKEERTSILDSLWKLAALS